MRSIILLICMLFSFIPTAFARHGVFTQNGVASYYHGSLQGLRTANGDFYNKNRLTAAHRSLPFGSKVRVTNKDTGQSTIVTINDRGPFVKGRVIDLSTVAARSIGLTKKVGVCSVKLEVIHNGDNEYHFKPKLDRGSPTRHVSVKKKQVAKKKLKVLKARKLIKRKHANITKHKVKCKHVSKIKHCNHHKGKRK